MTHYVACAFMHEESGELRHVIGTEDGWIDLYRKCACPEAADELERLTKENEELRKSVDMLYEANQSYEGIEKELAALKAQSTEKPVASINIEERTLEWNGPILWDTPTTIKLPKIALYQAPPSTRAAVEAFKRRCVEEILKCSKRDDDMGAIVARIIEALPTGEE